MREQNRPYSIQNLIDNLKGAIKKALMTKVIAKLETDSKITVKGEKAKKVAFIRQEELEVLDPEELKTLEEEIKETSKQVSTTKEQVQSLNRKLDDIKRASTTEELKTEIATLKKECTFLEGEVQRLSGGITLATPEERKAALDSLRKYVTEWRKRKKIAMDVINAFSENMDQKPSEYMENNGIDEDERGAMERISKPLSGSK